MENERPQSDQKPEELGAKPSDKPVEFVEPEDGIGYDYANNIQIGFTVYDFRLRFGELVDVLPDKFVVEQRTQMAMSPLQAKTLLHYLGKCIQTYETQYGPIAVPPDLLT